MSTMSDDGDRTCPLCAEEMDLTDQQLKPCKCGYEICVWCWHHIMDMAEKDETEGRCPACRTAYDKERIIKMAANCERMVAEINAEKKHKAQKAKPRTSLEARKHLTSVRVIQRNLAYIVGLPMSICDENMLERREYFGQYGRVLKVSISRPTGPASQQGSANNTFSVYITYGKEDEAIRCIQAVHNFVLEGKILRACFGTTKYCHAWLRNMNCTNPDCLFLHEVGRQEDSFTKDEIISEYTRSRVPQMGCNSLQKRSGSILPPPVDEFSSTVPVSAKQGLKNGFSSTASQTKISPPASSAGRTTLPSAASWGVGNMSSRPASSGVSSSQNLSKQKADMNHHSILSSSANANPRHISAWDDDISTNTKGYETKQGTEAAITSKYVRPFNTPGLATDNGMTVAGASLDIDMSSVPSAWNDDDDDVVSSSVATEACGNGRVLQPNEYTVGSDKTESVSEVVHNPTKSSLLPRNDIKDKESSLSSVPDSLKSLTSRNCLNKQSESGGLINTAGTESVDLAIEKLSTDLSSSVFLDRNSGSGSSTKAAEQDVSSYSLPGSSPNWNMASSISCNQVGSALSHTVSKNDPIQTIIERNSYFGSEPLERHSTASCLDKKENDLLARSDQSLGHPSITSHLRTYPNHDFATNIPNYNMWKEVHPNGDNKLYSSTPKHVPYTADSGTLSNGHMVGDLGGICKPAEVFEPLGISRVDPEVNCAVKDAIAIKAANVHKEESSIISDILSLDFDPWDESSSSASNFAKILGESDDHDANFKLSASWIPKGSNESRFSFARQEVDGGYTESSHRDQNLERNFNIVSQNHNRGFQNYLGGQYAEESRDFVKAPTNSVYDRPTGFPSTSGASRCKISAPPGFSTPNRTPPPGFSSQGRSNQFIDPVFTENHLPENLMSANQYQANQGHLSRNSSDIEFLDPAILAVGKGRLSRANDSGLDMKPLPNFPPQFNAPNSDPRLQLLMQQALSSQQHYRSLGSIGDAYMPLNENYIASQLLAQNRGSVSPLTQLPVQQPRSSMLTNSHWDSWGDARVGSNMGITDILRNERLGINSFYPTNEENSNFHIPNSSDLYNRAFRM